MKTRNKAGFLAVCLALMVLVGVPVMAIGPANSHANAQAAAANGVGNAANSSSQAAAHQAAAQAKLTAAKLKACQNRQNAIDNIMARIANRGQKQLNLFTTIATKVEAFYTSSGKALSNYDSLVAAVNTQKAAAQKEVDAIKSSSTGFNCDGTNPKGFVSAFQGSLKSEISALQAYRTSVKNLIVGVKSVQGTTSSSSAGSNGSTQSSTGGTQ